MECLICYNEVLLRQFKRCNNCDKLICLNCNSLLNECPFCKFNFVETINNQNINQQNINIQFNKCKKCKRSIDYNYYFCNDCVEELKKMMLLILVVLDLFF